MTKATLHDDKHGDFIIEGFGVPIKGQWFLASNGRPFRALSQRNPDRTLLARIVKEYTLGRVVFEETGEERGPRKGEWYLSIVDGKTPWCENGNRRTAIRIILKPIRIEST